MAQDVIPPSPSKEEYSAAQPTGDAGLDGAQDPFALFAEWFAEAKKKEPNDANAMSLATVDGEGLPDVRMVLLKDFDAEGFVFYTNTTSAKGRELAENPRAALGFHWKSIRRQVRIRGVVSAVSAEEADAYFATRARDAQIGAWASTQSAPLEGRMALEKRVAEFALKFGVGPVPRPPHWSGYRISPVSIEFWRDRPFRLHDRLLFKRDGQKSAWSAGKLFP